MAFQYNFFLVHVADKTCLLRVTNYFRIKQNHSETTSNRTIVIKTNHFRYLSFLNQTFQPLFNNEQCEPHALYVKHAMVKKKYAAAIKIMSEKAYLSKKTHHCLS